MTKHSKSLPKAKPTTTSATATNKAKPATTSATAANKAKPATTSATAANKAKPATTSSPAANKAKPATTRDLRRAHGLSQPRLDSFAVRRRGERAADRLGGWRSSSSTSTDSSRSTTGWVMLSAISFSAVPQSA
jgi:hypothetical protein